MAANSLQSEAMVLDSEQFHNQNDPESQLTPCAQRDPSSENVRRSIKRRKTDVESDISQIENDTLGSESCSDSDEEGTSPSRLPTSKTLPRMNPRPACNFIENYKFPIIIEDVGKNERNQEKLHEYEFDLNSLFSLAQVGKVRATRRVAPGKYLVDCQSVSQRQALLQKKHLRTPTGGYIPIQCKLPQPITEGVIGPISVNVSKESINDKINEYNDKNPKARIQKFNRIQKYQGGVVQDTAFISLTFGCSVLPSAIHLGTTLYGVEVYRRNPILCGNCHLLGHSKAKCRKKEPLCGKCLQERHPCGEKECPVPKEKWYCRNCKKYGHSASWPRCPKKLLVKKALEVQAKTYMPLAAAIAVVKGDSNMNDNRPLTATKSAKKSLFHTPNHKQQFNDNFPSLNSGLKGLSQKTNEDAQFSLRPESGSLALSQKSRVGWSDQTTDNSISVSSKMLSSDNSVSINQDPLAAINARLDAMSKSITEIKEQKEANIKLIEDFIASKRNKVNKTENAILDIVSAFKDLSEGRSTKIQQIASQLAGDKSEIREDLMNEITVLVGTSF